MNELETHAGIAFFIVHLIQWMKTTNNPLMNWINPHTRGITTAVVWCCTTLAAVGIHWSFSGTITSGGVLQINLPPLDVVLTQGASLGVQALMQKVYYVAAVKAKTPQVATQVTPTQAVIQDIPKV